MGESPVEICIGLARFENETLWNYLGQATEIADLILQDVSSEFEVIQEDIEVIHGMNRKITGVFKEILAAILELDIPDEIKEAIQLEPLEPTLNFPLLIKGEPSNKEATLATLRRLLEEDVSDIRMAVRSRARAPPKWRNKKTQRRGREEFTGVTRRR
jgi:hypothetical protein